MPKGELSLFSSSVARLKEAYDEGTLYAKKIDRGQIRPKKGIEYLRAYFGKLIEWLMGGSQGYNEKLLVEMFHQCLSHYEQGTRDLKGKVKPLPLNTYNIKITHFVIDRLKKTGKLSTEKYRELKKEIEKEKQKVFASHLPEVVPKDFVSLIDDPDWKNIVSIHETIKLREKLDEKHPRLTEEEIALMKRCLRLYDKIERVKETIKLFPEQTLLINIDELDAIEKVTDIFFNKAQAIHESYKRDLGDVRVMQGKLKLTAEQRRCALDIANKEMKVLMENCTDPELKLQAERFVQIILCGKNEIARVNMLHSFNINILE